MQHALLSIKYPLVHDMVVSEDIFDLVMHQEIIVAHLDRNKCMQSARLGMACPPLTWYVGGGIHRERNRSEWPVHASVLTSHAEGWLH